MATYGTIQTQTATPRNVIWGGKPDLLPGGAVIDGSEARDIGNSPVFDLRAGLLLGKETSNGLWAPSIIGVTTADYSSGETTLTVSTATAVEIVRRIGSSGSGTIKITGYTSGDSSVTTKAITFSAVNTTNGEITVTDLQDDFDSGSFIQPADGSETILGILGDPYGVRVVDEDQNDIDVPASQIIIGGIIDTDYIVHYPSLALLKSWIKEQLRANGTGYAFDDDLS